MPLGLSQLPALFREVVRIFAEPVGALVATAVFVGVVVTAAAGIV